MRVLVDSDRLVYLPQPLAKMASGRGADSKKVEERMWLSGGGGWAFLGVISSPALNQFSDTGRSLFLKGP